MTWREALLAGKLSEAKTKFLESDEEIVVSSHFWLDLESLQKHLRAKHWQRAYNIIEDFEVPDGSLVELVDTEALLAEIEQLKECSMLLDRRRAEEALASLESISQPLLQAEKMCQQGTANIFLNETEEAKTLFTTALELDNFHYRVLTNLGNLYLEAGDLDTATSYYEKALAIKENFGNAMHNLGVVYRKQGQVAKSVSLIRKAQANLRKAEEADARGKLSSSVSGTMGSLFSGKKFQYLLYGVGLVMVLFLLRSRGVF